MNTIVKKLKDNYEIEISDYKEYKDGILFFVTGNYYLFVKCQYEEEYVQEIFRICRELRNRGVKLHDFVLSKDGKLIADAYILFKVNVLSLEIDFKDVLYFSGLNCNQYKKDYVYMDKFWEDKIDYLEMQLSELSQNKLLNNSFDYYVGIAEILVDYLRRNYEKGREQICLSHRCLTCLDSLEYYNPLNISFDLKYKDIAAYLRRSGDTNLILEEIEKTVGTMDYIYFFVRMTFPFDYFHELQEVLIDGKSNENLIRIVNRVGEYEKYLGEMQKLFGIYVFSWIKQ